MAMAAAVSRQQPNSWWLALLQGIAAILLGFMLLTAPGATLVTLVTFLGFYWLITGVLSVVRVFVDRSAGWVWSLLIGIIGVLAGIAVLNHPMLAAVTIPTVLVIVIGIEGLIMGVFELIRGFSGGGAGAFILGILPRLDRTAPPRTADGRRARGTVRLRSHPADRGCRALDLGRPRPCLRGQTRTLWTGSAHQAT